MLFKYDWLNKLALYIVVGVASMFALTLLWNFAMPALGVGKLTVAQFTALFVIFHSLKVELVRFKSSKPKIEETH